MRNDSPPENIVNDFSNNNNYRVEDGFAYTTSFTTYMMRPVDPGVHVVAKGRVTSVSKALMVAESTLEEVESGKLVAQGSGTFQRGSMPLQALKEYKEG